MFTGPTDLTFTTSLSPLPLSRSTDVFAILIEVAPMIVLVVMFVLMCFIRSVPVSPISFVKQPETASAVVALVYLSLVLVTLNTAVSTVILLDLQS